jgi:hypothetical protein
VAGTRMAVEARFAIGACLIAVASRLRDGK